MLYDAHGAAADLCSLVENNFRGFARKSPENQQTKLFRLTDWKSVYVTFI